MTLNKRDQLLRAACATIAERGVRGLRVEDVAARAGVAVSLVYYHFESRAGLLRASMKYADETSASTLVLRATNPDGSAYMKLEKALLAELGAGKKVRENCVVWNEMTASAVFDDELRALVTDETANWTRLIASFIEAGRADGSISQGIDSQRAADTVTTLLDGLILRWLSGSFTRKRARDLLRATLRERLEPERAVR